MLKIGPKGTWWELVSVLAYCPIIALSSGAMKDRGSKASPSPIADATSEGLMLSGFVRRDGGGLLGLELRLDEELLDADERTLGDLA